MLNIKYESKNLLPLLDNAAQHYLDQNWIELTGLSMEILVEQAGIAVADTVLKTLVENNVPIDTDTHILVVGGKGNNGSDAWVCARHLIARGLKVTCLDACLSADNRKNDVQIEALRKLGAVFVDLEDVGEMTIPELIVDGIMGTGFRSARGLSKEYELLFHQVRKWQLMKSYVVSIDIPSGVDANDGSIVNPCVHADKTVSFVAPKLGIIAAPGCTCAGGIEVVPLCMSPDWLKTILDQYQSQINKKLPVAINSDLIKQFRPYRPEDGHKGIFGRALLVGGSAGMVGAIALAGQAAARAGAGLITLAVSHAAFLPVLSAFPEGLTHDIDECENAFSCLKVLVDNKQVIAIGPGLGDPEWLPKFLELLIENAVQLVIDADALNKIAEDADRFLPLFLARHNRRLNAPVMTPHPGEFRRLAPELTHLLEQDRQQAALALARKYSSIVVLKGAATVVAHPDGRIYINTTGNDGMAKGGSGDCLTGIITGLLAQGMSPDKAAVSGVYLHGLAGDLAAEKIGQSNYLPQDLLVQMGRAWVNAGWLGKRSGDRMNR